MVTDINSHAFIPIHYRPLYFLDAHVVNPMYAPITDAIAKKNQVKGSANIFNLESGMGPKSNIIVTTIIDINEVHAILLRFFHLILFPLPFTGVLGFS